MTDRYKEYCIFKKMIKKSTLTDTHTHAHTHARALTLSLSNSPPPTNVHFLETKLDLKTSLLQRWEEEKDEERGRRTAGAQSPLPPQGSGAKWSMVGSKAARGGDCLVLLLLPPGAPAGIPAPR